jgi:cell division protein FtsW (lipid II flippase)
LRFGDFDLFPFSDSENDFRYKMDEPLGKLYSFPVMPFTAMLVFFLLLLLVIGVPSAGVAAYITTVPCRILVSRRRRPGWYIAVIVAVFVGALAVLLFGGTDVFHPSRWDRGKATLREMAPLWFVAASVGALVPALFVVRHYREKLEQSKCSL